MKIIALLPVRNEAWMLPHSLACLSAFCDVVLVSDQDSEDESREICRAFSPRSVAARIVRAAGVRTGAMAAARRGARLRGLQSAVVHRRGRADVAGRWRRRFVDASRGDLEAWHGSRVPLLPPVSSAPIGYRSERDTHRALLEGARAA